MHCQSKLFLLFAKIPPFHNPAQAADADGFLSAKRREEMPCHGVFTHWAAGMVGFRPRPRGIYLLFSEGYACR